MPRIPCIYTITFFLIIKKLSLIFITLRITLLPNTMTLTNSFLEMSFVIASIFPIILSKSIKFTIKILSFVYITTVEFLDSLSIFNKMMKLTLISITVRLAKDSKTLGLPLLPLTNINIAFFAFPHSSPILHIVFPLSIIKLPIIPFIFS